MTTPALQLSHTSFQFKKRNLKLNWDLLNSISIEKILVNNDIDELQKNLENIVYSDLTDDDYTIYFTDSNLTQLIRIFQLAVEYLLFAQNYLLKQITVANKENQTILEKSLLLKEKTKEKLIKQAEKITILRKELEYSKQANKIYEKAKNLADFPADPEEKEQPASEESKSSFPAVFRCGECTSSFVSYAYLAGHYQRRHPAADITKHNLSRENKNFQKNQEELDQINTEKARVALLLAELEQKTLEFTEKQTKLKFERKNLKLLEEEMEKSRSREAEKLLHQQNKLEEARESADTRLLALRQKELELEIRRAELERWEERLKMAENQVESTRKLQETQRRDEKPALSVEDLSILREDMQKSIENNISQAFLAQKAVEQDLLSAKFSEFQQSISAQQEKLLGSMSPAPSSPAVDQRVEELVQKLRAEKERKAEEERKMVELAREKQETEAKQQEERERLAKQISEKEKAEKLKFTLEFYSDAKFPHKSFPFLSSRFPHTALEIESLEQRVNNEMENTGADGLAALEQQLTARQIGKIEQEAIGIEADLHVYETLDEDHPSVQTILNQADQLEQRENRLNALITQETHNSAQRLPQQAERDQQQSSSLQLEGQPQIPLLHLQPIVAAVQPVPVISTAEQLRVLELQRAEQQAAQLAAHNRELEARRQLIEQERRHQELFAQQQQQLALQQATARAAASEAEAARLAHIVAVQTAERVRAEAHQRAAEEERARKVAEEQQRIQLLAELELQNLAQQRNHDEKLQQQAKQQQVAVLTPLLPVLPAALATQAVTATPAATVPPVAAITAVSSIIQESKTEALVSVAAVPTALESKEQIVSNTVTSVASFVLTANVAKESKVEPPVNPPQATPVHSLINSSAPPSNINSMRAAPEGKQEGNVTTPAVSYSDDEFESENDEDFLNEFKKPEQEREIVKTVFKKPVLSVANTASNLSNKEMSIFSPVSQPGIIGADRQASHSSNLLYSDSPEPSPLPSSTGNKHPNELFSPSASVQPGAATNQLAATGEIEGKPFHSASAAIPPAVKSASRSLETPQSPLSDISIEEEVDLSLDSDEDILAELVPSSASRGKSADQTQEIDFQALSKAAQIQAAPAPAHAAAAAASVAPASSSVIVSGTVAASRAALFNQGGLFAGGKMLNPEEKSRQDEINRKSQQAISTAANKGGEIQNYVQLARPKTVNKRAPPSAAAFSFNPKA
jgi:hypothetical protein